MALRTTIAGWLKVIRGQEGEFMSLYIEKEQSADVAVLQCAGRMVRTEALCLLRDAVTSLPDVRVIVLDLSEVAILGAGGLGMLVFLHNWSCANGIQLKLVNPSKFVREMLALTGLTSVLHISSVKDVIRIFCNSGRTIEIAERAAV
jgi:anti-anti-sigma factor